MKSNEQTHIFVVYAVAEDHHIVAKCSKMHGVREIQKSILKAESNSDRASEYSVPLREGCFNYCVTEFAQSAAEARVEAKARGLTYGDMDTLADNWARRLELHDLASQKMKEYTEGEIDYLQRIGVLIPFSFG